VTVLDGKLYAMGKLVLCQWMILITENQCSFMVICTVRNCIWQKMYLKLVFF
jgi:hypothetical protein